jgi:hypothetical protein
MSKIVRAVNTMITNQEKISNIIKKKKNYYFLYDDRYKWSIEYWEYKNIYYLRFFSGEQPLESIASMIDVEWATFDEMIVYSTEELGTKEAYDTFKDLYMILQERSLGVDKILDDIIKGDI